jgi:hypothetical protein
MINSRTTLLLAVLTAVVVLFDQPSVAEEKSEVGRWVEDLGSGEFAVRQRAMGLLAGAGVEAIGELTRAVGGKDAEVRKRAMAILVGHALSPREELRRSAKEAIGGLAESESPRVAQVASASLYQIREVTSRIAAEELGKLGATVMPVANQDPLTFNVQIRQTWRGSDERLALLADLGEVPWLSLENSPATDGALVQIAKLGSGGRGPSKLYLGNSGISGIGLERLAALERLEYLSLKQLPIDDAKLARLPGFPGLQYLGLDGTQVGDEGLKLLSRYPQLQVLWLDQTRVTDAGLVHLQSLGSLRTLYLPGTNTGGAGLAELRRLPSLSSLSLKGVSLSAQSLKHVAQLEQLESLGLDMTNVRDEHLSDLAGLTRLRILWLSGTRISDAGLESLKNLKSLQIVHLTDTQVTSEGAAELQRALPGCQVTVSKPTEESQGQRRMAPGR